jgi:LPXTG-site transpeptidase (sortase) family protein
MRGLFLIMTSASRNGIIESIGKTGAFFITFGIVFVLMLAFLGAMDSLPELSHTVSQNTGSTQAPVVAVTNTANPESPVRVVAPAIGMNIAVLNPASTDNEVLDAALLKGAVRYPTSAMLGVEGTVLLFGHSSYLPIVHNQNYKGFNGIQNLKVGQTISVYSGSYEYRYSVVSVKLADASQDVVELPATGRHLILVTCDSFSKKTSRFIVTADLVGTYSLASR